MKTNTDLDVGVIAQVAETDGLPFPRLLGLHFYPQSVRRSVEVRAILPCYPVGNAFSNAKAS